MRRFATAGLFIAALSCLLALAALSGCGAASHPAASHPAASLSSTGLRARFPTAEPTEYAAGLKIYDLASGRTSQIPGTRPVVRGAVNGDWTVGLVPSKLPPPPSFGPNSDMVWDLRACNVRTGEQFTLMQGGEWWPYVSGDWVVWEHDLSPTDSDIYAFNLRTRELRPVCVAPGAQCWPQISGRWIVWDDSRSDCRISAYDLATGGTRIVSATGTSPMISGAWVIWGDHGIHALNLASGKQVRVSNEGTTEGYNNGSAAFGGDWVVWVQGQTLKALDLVTGERRTVALCRGGPDSMVIAGRWVAWRTWYGRVRILACDLETGRRIIVAKALHGGALNGLASVGRWILWDHGAGLRFIDPGSLTHARAEG